MGDNPQRFSDDLHGWITALRWLEPTTGSGGDFEAQLYHAYRWAKDNDTGVSAIGGRLMSKLETTSTPASRAPSSPARRARSPLPIESSRTTPRSKQDVHQLGARAVVRYDHPWYSLYLEGDYASGDSDPSIQTPLTQFRFAEGHARRPPAVRARARLSVGPRRGGGIAVLQNLNAPSLPLDQVATRGSFTNAAALFPQVDLHPVSGPPRSRGVLFAWAPARVVDPIASLQRRDGLRIDDDLVNFRAESRGAITAPNSTSGCNIASSPHFAADLRRRHAPPGSALRGMPMATRCEASPPDPSLVLLLMKRLVLLPVLFVAAVACEEYSAPPEPTIVGLVRGGLTDSRAPLVVDFGTEIDPATLKITLAFDETDLGATCSTGRRPEYRASRARHDAVGGRKRVTLNHDQVFPVGPQARSHRRARPEIEVRPRARIPREGAIRLYRRLHRRLTRLASGRYFMLLQVAKPLQFQLELFGDLTIDAKTGAVRGRFTNADRRSDLTCPTTCTNGDVCRLLPAPGCVLPSELAGSVDSIRTGSRSPPPTGFEFIADGCASDGEQEHAAS